MRRSDFVGFLGSAAAWVATAGAQDPQHVIGFLSGLSHLPNALAACCQGLKESGSADGQNRANYRDH
jgi:hypothetical protein